MISIIIIIIEIRSFLYRGESDLWLEQLLYLFIRSLARSLVALELVARRSHLQQSDETGTARERELEGAPGGGPHEHRSVFRDIITTRWSAGHGCGGRDGAAAEQCKHRRLS